MLSMDLTAEYADRIRPLLPLAQAARGARTTDSPAHEASREVTRLLLEYTEKGGKILPLSKALGVGHAGLNRRVKQAGSPASQGRARKQFTNEQIADAVADIQAAKAMGTERYGLTIQRFWDHGYPLNTIAKQMGLSSANPLYYYVHR